MVELADDDPGAIDILLVYLYTLDTPEFSKPVRSGAIQRAEKAYVIGDKYQVLPLKRMGQRFMIELTRKFLWQWCDYEPLGRSGWVRSIRKVWSEEFPPANEIKAVYLEEMVGIAKHMVEEPAFQTLLRENLEFNLEFVRALAQKASRK